MLHNVDVNPRPSNDPGFRPKTDRNPFFWVTPKLKVARRKALDWRRHEKNIGKKKNVNWFNLMRAQPEEAGVLQENPYDIYYIGVLLSVLGSSRHT